MLLGEYIAQYANGLQVGEDPRYSAYNSRGVGSP